MTTMFISTRKGLFVYDVNGNQVQMSGQHFLGDPVSAFTVDALSHWYVALNLGHFGPKFHRSINGGQSWQEMACPALPEKPENSGDSSDWQLKQVWVLEADPAVPGKIMAGTIPGAIFETNDGAASWQLNEAFWALPQRTAWFGGGFDDSGVHSIAIHPHNSKQMTAAVSVGGIWHTLNGGKTWELKCSGMQADYMPEDMQDQDNLQDPHRLVQSPTRLSRMWVQHHCGIFVSDDSGRHWDQCYPQGQAGFGFTVVVHPHDADIAWFVPAIKDESRYPVDGALKVTKTVDGGKTFITQTEGLPQSDCFDLVYRHAMDINRSGEVLAMGSTTGNLWISHTGGDSWECVSHFLPPIYAVKIVD